MAYSPLHVLERIHDVLAPDLASVAKSVTHTVAPPNTKVEAGTLPYVVIELEPSKAIDTFTSDEFEIQFGVHIYDAIGNGAAQSAAAFDAVYGNADPGSDTKATSGLHRREPGGLSPDSLGQIVCLRIDQGADDEVLEHYLGFQVNYQRG